ncbi:hypothetical protein WN944_020075 [Citrus x changshan-huyou]|uniref:Uncharacterized protein n=1 Tax=Citrus x changshan-huyou TaxID=2935761 RepID=A0AAP0LWN3_9ROSI
MSDWGPVFVAVILFVLLSPGLLFQVPGRHRCVEFGNFQTSGAAIMVHSLLYFALVCVFFLAVKNGIVIKRQTQLRSMGTWKQYNFAITMMTLGLNLEKLLRSINVFKEAWPRDYLEDVISMYFSNLGGLRET